MLADATATDVKSSNILSAMAIALGTLLAGTIFYYVLRRITRILADKTSITIGNLLAESLEWPLFAAITLTGPYFTFYPDGSGR